MKKRISDFLKKFPFLVDLVRWRYSETGFLKFKLVNILKEFPLYKPYGAGDFNSKSLLTINTINSIFKSLDRLVIQVQKNANQNIFIPIKSSEFSKNQNIKKSSKELLQLFTEYGSDKGEIFSEIYSSLFTNRMNVKKILEVGIGSNNQRIVSNMTRLGKPGSSLRAFRDFFPKAFINGADIDENILFSEDRIKTFKVDQTNIKSLENLKKSIGSEFDLIIDDGLHSPDANINTLVLGLQLIKINGWIIIEDIPDTKDHKYLWNVILQTLICDKYEIHLIKTKNSFAVAVKKLK